MSLAQTASTDLVEELRLRRWARENYVPPNRRDELWHPVVLDEMQRRDREAVESDGYAEIARRIVPLVPENGWRLHGPHAETVRAAPLVRVPDVSARSP